mmetsp:Transcript_23048/g.91397  ORF Transcript_23048/g.91397 Transcript_23048/m.91397 type:complete len:453 (-) Transcript_23048:480-1838(-)
MAEDDDDGVVEGHPKPEAPAPAPKRQRTEADPPPTDADEARPPPKEEGDPPPAITPETMTIDALKAIVASRVTDDDDAGEARRRRGRGFSMTTPSLGLGLRRPGAWSKSSPSQNDDERGGLVAAGGDDDVGDEYSSDAASVPSPTRGLSPNGRRAFAGQNGASVEERAAPLAPVLQTRYLHTITAALGEEEAQGRAGWTGAAPRPDTEDHHHHHPQGTPTTTSTPTETNGVPAGAPPRSRDSDEGAPSRLPAPHTMPRKKPLRRVLVVDDSCAVRRFVQRIFESRGYAVDACQNGWQAFAQMKNRLYDFVFLDIEMPVMNGYRCAQALRKWEAEVRRPHNQVLCALTSHALPEERSLGSSVGMDYYEAKPALPKRLLDIVDRSIAEAAASTTSTTDEASSSPVAAAASSAPKPSGLGVVAPPPAPPEIIIGVPPGEAPTPRAADDVAAAAAS